jgi:hypothetical protein
MSSLKGTVEIKASLRTLNETDFNKSSNKVNIGNNKTDEEEYFAIINNALENMNDDEFEKFSRIIDSGHMLNNIV